MFQFLQCLLQVLRGLGLELRDSQIAKIRFQQAAFDAPDLNDFPDQLDLERFFRAFPDDGQSDRTIWLASHPLDGIGQRHALDRGIVQTDDQVAGAKASPLGGRIVDRGNDLDETTVFLPDFDAQAAKFAGRADLQVLECFGVQVGGMGVEIAQHAANRVFQQILVLDRLHIILLDGIEYAGEGAQLIQREPVALSRCFLLGPNGMHRRQ